MTQSLTQRREVEGLERCLVNTLAQDLAVYTPSRSGSVEGEGGDSMTPCETCVVDDQIGTSMHITAIDISSDKWNVQDICSHKGCGNDKAGGVSCGAALDDKPEHLFLTHLYSHDLIPQVVATSLDIMTIGTHQF